MLTMSLLSTALSFFVSPVCADLGFGRGSFTLYYSLMLSVMTAFVAVGSVAEGVLCSRFGIVRTLTTVLALYAVGFSLLALGSSALGTLMPVVVRQLFGGRDYAAIWSVVISCSSVASFIGAPVWGMVYDFSGSYRPALMVMPVVLAAGIACLFGAFRNIED